MLISNEVFWPDTQVAQILTTLDQMWALNPRLEYLELLKRKVVTRVGLISGFRDLLYFNYGRSINWVGTWTLRPSPSPSCRTHLPNALAPLPPPSSLPTRAPSPPTLPPRGPRGPRGAAEASGLLSHLPKLSERGWQAFLPPSLMLPCSLAAGGREGGIQTRWMAQYL